MSHAAVLPRLPLDAKRIIATSGAIAVHVGILMMLMMPPEVVRPEAKDEVVEVHLDERKPIRPPDPPPIEKIKPQPVHQAQAPQIPIPDVQVEPVDAPPAPIDIVAPLVPQVPNTFDAGPAPSPFQQLAIAAGAPPPYPRMAIQRGIEGTVMLRVHVDAGGRPLEVIVEQSSGSRILDEAAQKFIKAKWRFVPAQSNGQAVEAWGLVPMEFVLE